MTQQGVVHPDCEVFRPLSEAPAFPGYDIEIDRVVAIDPEVIPAHFTIRNWDDIVGLSTYGITYWKYKTWSNDTSLEGASIVLFIGSAPGARRLVAIIDLDVRILTPTELLNL